MKLFVFVIGFLIVFFTIVIIVILHYLRKGMKHFAKTVTGDIDEEEAFRRMADKHYRGKNKDPKFDKDYFKSSTGSTTSDGKQTHHQNQRKAGQQNQQQSQSQQQQQQQTRRTTTTQEGVTIIDERTHTDQRKIFADDEGEYVEFTEE